MYAVAQVRLLRVEIEELNLIRKYKDFSPESLLVDWKPLYGRYQDLFVKRQIGPQPAMHMRKNSVLIALIGKCQRFFSVSAASEILNELRPSMNPLKLDDFSNKMGAICLFLPMHAFSVWKSGVFDLWSRADSPSIDVLVLDLLARTCADKRQIAFELNPDELAQVFTAGVGSFGIPDLTHHSSETSSLITVMNTSDSFGTIVAYSLDHGSFDLLSDLLFSVEPYFHPSNQNSRWTPNLSGFLLSLASYCLIRHQSSNACIDQRLVAALLTPTFMTLFGKNQIGTQNAQKTLRILAELQPDIVLAPLVDYSYSSLRCITETHRTTAIIGALGHVSCILFSVDRFAQGLEHLVPLLHLTIAGLDINDCPKTLLTLLFYAQVCSSVPFLTILGEDSSQMDDKYKDAACSLKQQASDVEDWLFLFLDKVFGILDNLPVGHAIKKKSATVEETVLDLLSVFMCLFD